MVAILGGSMRMLIWRCDHFRSERGEKGRSKVRDDDGAPLTDVPECLLVLAASEKTDEPNPVLIAEHAAAELIAAGAQLGVKTVVLHSFAHLFVELSAPQV